MLIASTVTAFERARSQSKHDTVHASRKQVEVLINVIVSQSSERTNNTVSPQAPTLPNARHWQTFTIATSMITIEDMCSGSLHGVTTT